MYTILYITIHASTHTLMHACIHTYTNTSMHPYIQTYIYTYIHVALGLGTIGFWETLRPLISAGDPQAQDLFQHYNI